VRVLHLADLHLGWQPARWPRARAERRRDRRDAVLERAVDVGLEAGVDAVVVVGDLFETFDPPEPLVERALVQLRRLVTAGVRLVTVPGNHDELTYGASVYRRRREDWPGVLVTNPLPAEVARLDVAGEVLHVVSLAYTGGVTPASAPLRDFPRSGEPGFHLAAFHGTLGLPADDRSLPLDEGALASAGYHYVALGHLHRPYRRELRSGPAVYAGCLEGKGFDDPGVPFLTLASWDGAAARIEEIPFDVQPIRDTVVDVTQVREPRELDDVIESMADPDAIQRVRLTGALHLPPVDAAALEARHEGAFFHLEIDDRTAAIAPDLVERWAAEPTIRGAFAERMQRLLQGADEDHRRTVERALRFGVAALQQGRGGGETRGGGSGAAGGRGPG